MSTNDKDPVIDPEVKKEIEQMDSEEPIVEYFSQGTEETERISFVETWFPDRDEWQGKTNISPHQARSLALVRSLPKAFPEIEAMEPFLTNLVDDYEKYLTSIDGIAREQQASILRSMFGGSSEIDDESKGMIRAALTGQMGDNDND